MTIHGVIALVTFVESWINTPSESIPEPGSENKEDEDDKKEKSEDEGSLKITRYCSIVKALYRHVLKRHISEHKILFQKFHHLCPFYFQFHASSHW